GRPRSSLETHGRRASPCFGATMDEHAASRTIGRRLLAALERLGRSLLPLGLGIGLIAGIGLYSVLAQEDQPLRLSVVGHWASVPEKGRAVRLGRGAEADLRLLDPLADAEIHAEL